MAHSLHSGWRITTPVLPYFPPPFLAPCGLSTGVLRHSLVSPSTLPQLLTLRFCSGAMPLFRDLCSSSVSVGRPSPSRVGKSPSISDLSKTRPSRRHPSDTTPNGDCVICTCVPSTFSPPPFTEGRLPSVSDLRDSATAFRVAPPSSNNCTIPPFFQHILQDLLFLQQFHLLSRDFSSMSLIS